MSKKSLLYIIIIIFVLTSGFFLASNYKSSIDMKNRGENIVPSVNNVEDIKKPQIEFRKEMQINEECNNADAANPYFCENSGSCCNANDYCLSLQGTLVNDVCYDDMNDYCSVNYPATPSYNGESCVCNGYTSGDSCVDSCPAGTYINGRTCVSECPNDKYYNGNSCVSECPNDKYYNGNSCVTECPNDKYYNGNSCVTECPSGTYYNGNSCVTECPSGKYYDGNSCVTQCTNGKHYEGNSCVTNCSTNLLDTVTNTCVSLCPNERKYNDNGICKSSCPKYVDGTTCVTACSNLRVGNTCVSSCPSDSPYIANGVCYNASQCRSIFDNQGYPNGTTCYNNQLAYCKTLDPAFDIVYENNCYTKNSDPYCIASRGTHYSGGGCRTNQAECVALEGTGADYRGDPNEKYSSSKCDSMADQCSRQGKVLYGGVCKTHQEMCEIRNGKWKNGTCISNNNGGAGVSGKTSNKNKEDNPKTDDVIGTDATLSNIILSSGRLMFTPGTLDYRVEVSSNVESITIEPVTTDPDATFVVNGDTKLKPGENSFTIVVTAEDGKATLTYNVIIVRTDRILSSNSKASLIEITNHEINFDKDQTDYEVDLTIDEDELDIKVTAEDNLSITEIFGNEGLQNGDIVTVKLTAEDGSYTVYAIKVNKEEPFNIKDYIPYIIAGVAGLLLIIVGAAILRGRKSNDSEDKEKDDDKDDFKMKSKD